MGEGGSESSADRYDAVLLPDDRLILCSLDVSLFLSRSLVSSTNVKRRSRKEHPFFMTCSSCSACCWSLSSCAGTLTIAASLIPFCRPSLPCSRLFCSVFVLLVIARRGILVSRSPAEQVVCQRDTNTREKSVFCVSEQEKEPRICSF